MDRLRLTLATILRELKMANTTYTDFTGGMKLKNPRNDTLTSDDAMNELYKPPFEDKAGYEDDFRRFVDAMRYKMKRNAHKGRWEDIGLIEAQMLLGKEVEELKEAIRDGNMIEIILEAADVANFAMIVSAIAVERGK
jgi:hypothetical protein